MGFVAQDNFWHGRSEGVKGKSYTGDGIEYLLKQGLIKDEAAELRAKAAKLDAEAKVAEEAAKKAADDAEKASDAASAAEAEKPAGKGKAKAS